MQQQAQRNKEQKEKAVEKKEITTMEFKVEGCKIPKSIIL